MSGTVRRQRPKFAMLPESLLRAEVGDRAVRLYAVLDRYANKDEDKAWPARETLAEWLHCSTDSVDRAVRDLESAGYLRVERRGGERQSNNYYLLERPKRRDSRTAATTDGRKGATVDGRKSAGLVAAGLRPERKKENETCGQCANGWIETPDGVVRCDCLEAA